MGASKRDIVKFTASAAAAFVLCASILIGSAPVVAQDHTSGQASAPVTSSEKAKPLAIIAERINLKVRSFPELSGEYRINEDGTISIPVLGRVPLGDSTASAFETLLAERFSKVAARDVYVSLEISMYRPVFVTGAVNTPGTPQWRPGLTVLQAVSLAGGTLNRRDDRNAQTSPALRIALLNDSYQRLIAAKARLQAEKANATAIAIPTTLTAAAGDEIAKGLIQAEQAYLDLRRSSINAVYSTLDAKQKAVQAEVDELDKETPTILARLAARKEYLDQLRDLVKRGASSIPRLTDQEDLVWAIETSLNEKRVAKSRALAIIAGLEIDRVATKRQRDESIDQDLQRVERELAQTQIELSSLLALPAGAEPTQQPARFIYSIVRRGKDTSSRMDVREFDAVEPDDVLIVTDNR